MIKSTSLECLSTTRDSWNGQIVYIWKKLRFNSTGGESHGKPSGTNASIFIVGHSDDLNSMPVRAIYDIDFDTPSGKTGTYASVKRYQYGTLTNYYDCYFEQGTGSAFAPVFVHFERQARRSTVEADAIQRLKQGPGQPFYMIWWPDPGMPYLERIAAVPTYPATDPRIDYGHMGGRTALTFVVPAYPSL